MAFPKPERQVLLREGARALAPNSWGRVVFRPSLFSDLITRCTPQHISLKPSAHRRKRAEAGAEQNQTTTAIVDPDPDEITTTCPQEYEAGDMKRTPIRALFISPCRPSMARIYSDTLAWNPTGIDSVSSYKIGDTAAERPSFVGSLGPISPLGVVPAAGGVIVVDADGKPLGAVGVTGDTSDNDEICALAGIAAAGLTAQA